MSFSGWAAMSAIERRMRPVDIGSSMVSAAAPKKPPAAPVAAAAAVWKRRPVNLGLSPRVKTATSSAFMSAASVALWTVFCTGAGSNFMPFSMGEPRIAAKRAASPGCSRVILARLRSASSETDSAIVVSKSRSR